MENLEQQLKNADAQQYKTPSPAVWAKIESRLSHPTQFSKRKLSTGAGLLRIAAAITAIAVLSAIYILIHDNLNRHDTWLACADCTEWLHDEISGYSIPVAAASRSLYQPASLALYDLDFKAPVQRLSYNGHTSQARFMDVVAKLSPHPDDLSHETVPVKEFNWRSVDDHSNNFTDEFQLTTGGAFYWQRKTSIENADIRVHGHLDDNGVLELEMETGNALLTTSGVIRGQYIYIDMSLLDGKIYRWRMPRSGKVLFTSIIPMYSYTAMNTENFLRLAEHNILCSVY